MEYFFFKKIILLDWLPKKVSKCKKKNYVCFSHRVLPIGATRLLEEISFLTFFWSIHLGIVRGLTAISLQERTKNVTHLQHLTHLRLILKVFKNTNKIFLFCVLLFKEIIVQLLLSYYYHKICV